MVEFADNPVALIIATVAGLFLLSVLATVWKAGSEEEHVDAFASTQNGRSSQGRSFFSRRRAYPWSPPFPSSRPELIPA